MHISHMKLKMAVFYSVSPNYKEENNVSLGSFYLLYCSKSKVLQVPLILICRFVSLEQKRCFFESLHVEPPS